MVVLNDDDLAGGTGLLQLGQCPVPLAAAGIKGGEVVCNICRFGGFGVLLRAVVLLGVGANQGGIGAGGVQRGGQGGLIWAAIVAALVIRTAIAAVQGEDGQWPVIDAVIGVLLGCGAVLR